VTYGTVLRAELSSPMGNIRYYSFITSARVYI